MNKFANAALRFLAENWGTILEGAEGADMIGVNRATLRTRIAKEQAMAMRDTEGRERGRVEYTPLHLVYNMIYDALARFNSVPENEREWIFILTEQIGRDLREGKFNQGMVIRATKRDGKTKVSVFNNFEQLEQFTGEPVVVIPIGDMILRFAGTLAMKHNTDAMRELMAD